MSTTGSLFTIKHQSRDRLKLRYHSLTTVLAPLLIGVVLVFTALFILSSETKLHCQKSLGAASLNDVCTYQSTTILAQSSLMRAILPTFLTGAKYYYPLQHIQGANVLHTRKYDSETDSYSHHYDIILKQIPDVGSTEKQKQLADFIASPDNDHGDHYYTTKTIENFIFSQRSEPLEHNRFVARFQRMLEQYRRRPTEPILFDQDESSWLDEIVLLVGIGLSTFSLFFVKVTEEVTMDESTKSLFLDTKSLAGFTLSSELIPFSQIVEFKLNTHRSTTVIRNQQGHRFRSIEHVEQKINYGASLVVRDLVENGAFLQATQRHRAIPVSQYGSVPVENPPSPPSPLSSQEAVSDSGAGENNQAEAEPHQDGNTTTPPSDENCPEAVPSAPSEDAIAAHQSDSVEEELVVEEEEQEAQIDPPMNENGEYTHEFGEDGELILLNSPRNRFQSRQIPTQTRAQTQTDSRSGTSSSADDVGLTRNQTGDNNGIRVIPLLCGTNFGEVSLAAVREYVTVCTDWLAQFKDRQALLAESQLRVPIPPNSPNNASQSQTSPQSDGEGSSMCCICFSAPAKTVLMPCKHLVLCQQCAAVCDKCPSCRREIVYTIDVFN